MIDAAIDIFIRKVYALHRRQYGFLKGISMHHAMLRLTSQVRVKGGPLDPLDFMDAYLSVKKGQVLKQLKKVV